MDATAAPGAVQVATSSAGSKRIVLAAVGSRGDVQPYIVLGLALRDRGHAVTIATEERLRGLVDEFGLAYARIAGDSTGVLFQPEAQAALRDSSFLKLLRLTQEWDKRFDKGEILASYESACEGADVIVASGLTMTQTLCVAQAKGAAWVPMILGPTFPTAEYPLWALKSIAFLSCMNRWTYNAAFGSLWGQEQKDINAWRTTKLGLQPLPTSGKGSFDELMRLQPPTLIACSPLLCGPAGRVPEDYPSWVHVGGFLFAPDHDLDGAGGTAGQTQAAGQGKDGPATTAAVSAPALAVDPRVSSFLSSPDPHPTPSSGRARPIIYLGFGSMPAPDPTALLQLAIDTCKAAGCRAVLVAGWSELRAKPEAAALVAQAEADGTLLVAKAVPHGWLFPRVAAIVHHCGVGTMAAALRAGVPQIPVPFMLDQPHNASLLVQLGVAPAVLPFAKLTSAALAREVEKVLGEGGSGPMTTAALSVADRVRRESAGTKATFCALIEGAGRV